MIPVVNNKKLLLLLPTLLLSLNAHADVQAYFSTNQVSKGESVDLIFESTEKIQKLPDLSVLYQDFKIASQGQSSNTQIINGKVTQEYQIILTLFPLKTGEITVEPFEINGEKTNALSLKVQESFLNNEENNKNAQTTENAEKIKIDVTSFFENPVLYEGQTGLFVVQIKDNANLVNPQLQLPVLEELNFTKAKETEVKTEIVDSQKINTYKNYYFVTPKKTGVYEVPGAALSGSISVEKKSHKRLDMFSHHFGFDPFVEEVKPIFLQSEKTKLTVLEKPQNITGWWLPSQRVELKEDYIVSDNIKVGETIERSVTLAALNIDSSKLPAIVQKDITNANAYANPEERFNLVKDNNIIGVEKKSFVIIPVKSGEITIPEIKVSWFDVVSKTIKTEILPEKKVMIHEANNIENIQNNVENKKNVKNIQNEEKQQIIPNKKSENKGVLLIILLGVASIFFGVFIFFIHKVKKHKNLKIEKENYKFKKKKKKPLPDLYLDD